MDSQQSIKPLVSGATPSLLDTVKGNELITAINSILALQINPQGFGKLTLGDKNAILDLTPLETLIDQLSTTVAAFSQANGGGGASGGGGNVSLIQAQIDCFNIVCNDDGTISWTFDCDDDLGG